MNGLVPFCTISGFSDKLPLLFIQVLAIEMNHRTKLIFAFFDLTPLSVNFISDEI